MAGPTAHHRPEKDAGPKTIARISCALRLGALVMFALAAVSGTAAQAVDELTQLQQHFDRETDGVRKAKLLRKLGDAQFAAERDAAKKNDYVAVGLAMEKYRDNVRAALEALKKARPDAEKHSGGYRELEMHTGRALREIRDVILTMPEQYRPPMQLVERELVDLDNEMLRLLFPRRPGEQPPLQQGASPSDSPKKPDDKPAPPEKQP